MKNYNKNIKLKSVQIQMCKYKMFVHRNYSNNSMIKKSRKQGEKVTKI